MKTGSPIGKLTHEEQTALSGNPPITMKSITILTCAILCLLPPAFAQKAATPPPTSTTSTIETVRREGIEFVITTNRKFNFVPIYSGDGESSLLLLEEFRTEISRDSEGSNSTMKVDAWFGKGSKPTKKVWTIKSDADEAAASDPFFKTTNYGCCGSYNVHTWYNLLTGQKVFTGTNNVVKISVPNTGGEALDRYVTFHSNQGAIEAPEMKRLKDVMGVLQYGTNKRVTHRIIVRASDAETLDLGVPEVGVSHQKETKFSDDYQEQEVALWAFDGKNTTSSLSEFTIILKWEETLRIEIPVKNDVPQLQDVKLPAKIKLEFPANPK